MADKKYLEGRVAIVTGSGQGVGRAIAIALAEQGAAVITNNRKPGHNVDSQLDDAKLARLSEEQRQWVADEFKRYGGDAETTAQTIRDNGGKAVACFADISDFDEAAKLTKAAIDNFGKVDIVVNVAGGFGFSPFEKMTPELFDKVNAVKPRGYFNVLRHAVPYMLENGWGRIINCTSRAFLGDIIKHAEYCTANAGVVGLTRALAIEYRDKGITANAFSPFARTRAAVDLAMFDKTVDSDDKAWGGEGAAPSTDRTPLPEELTPFISYLCTDAASKITGSVFALSGNSIRLYSDPMPIATAAKAKGESWSVEELVNNADRMLFSNYHNLVEQYMNKK
ncbi:MAG: SDR family oxidoreductase [Clostridia bacterium]|nr:SDR family oxidoreductase [Clostridia bacterium]